MVTSEADSVAGMITTTSDLLGRAVTYQDVWGNSTSSTYNQAGRLLSTSGPAGTQSWALDTAGRETSQSLDGTVVATANYTNGDLASVIYPSGAGDGGNGSSGTFSYDTSGRLSLASWSGAGGSALTTDNDTYTQDGKVTNELIDGSVQNTYSYDGPGRLTAATVPGHTLTYSYAPSASCGTLTNAGLNSDRTSSTDNGVLSTYCYGNDDQLTSSTNASYPEATYDAHGNATTLGAQNLSYDSSDRHMSSSDGTATVIYGRDAEDRIVSRIETVNGVTTENYRYGFSGPGDSPDFTTDASNSVVERTINLIGGAILTKRASTGDVWSYSNIHGDVVALANAAGLKQGPTVTYDPFGQAVSGEPDNSAGSYDYGWVGKNQKGTEQAAGLDQIEMGQRLYLPALGRFAQADPVFGGSSNDYDYASQDPLNKFDLSGTSIFGSIGHFVRKHWKAIAINTALVALAFVPGAGEVAIADEAAGLASRATARLILDTWDKGTFENVTRSFIYHYGKHAGEMTVREYAESSARFAAKYGASGARQVVRGSGGGILSSAGRVLSHW
jgi:large repetitive protein